MLTTIDNADKNLREQKNANNSSKSCMKVVDVREVFHMNRTLLGRITNQTV